jgi:hypothetical protein
MLEFLIDRKLFIIKPRHHQPSPIPRRFKPIREGMPRGRNVTDITFPQGPVKSTAYDTVAKPLATHVRHSNVAHWQN